MGQLFISNGFNGIVTHIYREGNRAANALARHGVEHGEAWWHSHPDFIASFIASDYVGRLNYRFVV